MSDTNEPSTSARSRAVVGFLAFSLLVATVVLAVWMVKNKPKANRRPPMAQTPVVEVQPLIRTNHLLQIDAMGVVIPAQEIKLQAEVSGRILEIHPALKAGGVVKAGEELVRLDARSYQTALSQRQASLEMALSNLELEKGQQTIAKADLDLMGGVVTNTVVNRTLALRGPQLRVAQANVDAAKAGVEEAGLSLVRTKMQAPWDAVVLQANAEVGGQASPGTILAHLVGTKTFWIQVSVPVHHLRWIRFPENGETAPSKVSVQLDDADTREGVVLRRLPDLDTNARMARLLVAVDDPLGLGKQGNQAPLLLNDFVSVRILGEELQDVYVISRTALRDGDAVWLMGEDHTLYTQTVDVLWGNQEYVILADSFGPGKQLIVSALAAPVEGMRLRTTDEAREQQAQESRSASEGQAMQLRPEPAPAQNIKAPETNENAEVNRGE